MAQKYCDRDWSRDWICIQTSKWPNNFFHLVLGHFKFEFQNGPKLQNGSFLKWLKLQIDPISIWLPNGRIFNFLLRLNGPSWNWAILKSGPFEIQTSKWPKTKRKNNWATLKFECIQSRGPSLSQQFWAILKPISYDCKDIRFSRVI